MLDRQSIIRPPESTILMWNRSLIHGLEWLLTVNAKSFKTDYLFWLKLNDDDLNDRDKKDLALLDKEFGSTNDLYGYKNKIRLMFALEQNEGYFARGRDSDPWYHIVGKKNISDVKTDLTDAIDMVNYWATPKEKIPIFCDRFHIFCTHYGCNLTKNCMFLFSQDLLGLLSIPDIYPDSVGENIIYDLNKISRSGILKILKGNAISTEHKIGWPVKIKDYEYIADPLVTSCVLNYIIHSQHYPDELTRWIKNENIIKRIISFIENSFQERESELREIPNTNPLENGLWKSKFAGPSGYEVDSSLSETIEISQVLINVLKNGTNIPEDAKDSVAKIVNNVIKYCHSKIIKDEYLTYCFERDRYFKLSPVSDIKGLIQIIDFILDLRSLTKSDLGKIEIELIDQIGGELINLTSKLIELQGDGGWWPILSNQIFDSPKVREELNKSTDFKIAINPKLNNISFDNTILALLVLTEVTKVLSTVNSDKICPKCQTKYEYDAIYCGIDGTELESL